MAALCEETDIMAWGQEGSDGANNMDHDDEAAQQAWTGLYRWLFTGACAVILGLAGTLVGVWSSGVEQALVTLRTTQDAIWKTVNERNSLPGRTSEVERRTDDQEARIRVLERQVWKREH